MERLPLTPIDRKRLRSHVQITRRLLGIVSIGLALMVAVWLGITSTIKGEGISASLSFRIATVLPWVVALALFTVTIAYWSILSDLRANYKIAIRATAHTLEADGISLHQNHPPLKFALPFDPRYLLSPHSPIQITYAPNTQIVLDLAQAGKSIDLDKAERLFPQQK